MLSQRIILGKVKSNGFYLGEVNQKTLKLAKEFGEIVPQYQGEDIFDVKPDPNMQDYYFSQNKKMLFPHSEAYEFDIPPRYVLLACREPDKFGHGLTVLSDMHHFLTTLKSSELQFITTKKYLFHSNSGLQKKGFYRESLSSIYDKEKRIFRYSYNNMSYDMHDEKTKNILSKIKDYYINNSSTILLKRNQFIIIDNYRMLHGRTSFLDPNRWLERIWID